MNKVIQLLDNPFAKQLVVAAAAMTASTLAFAAWKHFGPKPLRVWAVTSTKTDVVYMVFAYTEEEVGDIMSRHDVTYAEVTECGVAKAGCKAGTIKAL